MHHNTAEIAALQPDYLGFIFWEPSKRNYTKSNETVPEGIVKTGVFVKAPVETIIQNVKSHDLKAIQLHGNETVEELIELKKQLKKEGISVAVIKVFSVKNSFNFNVLAPFEAHCDFFLFDTKGELPGGNGTHFSWQLLQNYSSTKPYFLSGGIGLNDIEAIGNFYRSPAATYCHAIDVNSKFETAPGHKNSTALRTFVTAIASLKK